MVVNVENEINKYKTCRDRGELEKYIQEYKELAMEHATNFTLAGQYDMIAHKLQEICDRLPAPNLFHHSGSASNTPVKTVTLTNEEEAKINAAWKQRAGSKHNDVKR